jgi:hypothetical protein
LRARRPDLKLREDVFGQDYFANGTTFAGAQPDQVVSPVTLPDRELPVGDMGAVPPYKKLLKPVDDEEVLALVVQALDQLEAV